MGPIPSNLSTGVACRNAAQCLEVFCVWEDRSIRHIRQQVPNGDWSGWTRMGAQSHSSAPAVVLSQTGRLYVFTRNDSDGLWFRVQKTPDSGWTPWTPIDETLSAPAAASNRDGRLEVFGQVLFGQVRYMAQQAVDGDQWTGPTSVGGKVLGVPTVGENLDGRLELFARDSSNALTHIWQADSGQYWIREWEPSLGRLLGSDPVCARNADGRLEVFARGDDGTLRHVWQLAPNNGWSNLDSRGGQITTKPAVGVNADGRLEVFARGTDNALWHIWQTAPSNGWSEWWSLGGQITSEPTCALNADGRLEVFARGTDNALWHIRQDSPGGGWAHWDWSGWESLGGDLRTL